MWLLVVATLAFKLRRVRQASWSFICDTCCIVSLSQSQQCAVLFVNMWGFRVIAAYSHSTLPFMFFFFCFFVSQSFIHCCCWTCEELHGVIYWERESLLCWFCCDRPWAGAYAAFLLPINMLTNILDNLRGFCFVQCVPPDPEAEQVKMTFGSLMPFVRLLSASLGA